MFDCLVIIYSFVSTLVVKILDSISSTRNDHEPKENARLIMKEMKIYIISANILKVKAIVFQACYKE